MNRKQLFLLLTFLSLGMSPLLAQTSFPEKCMGIWEGHMYIMAKGQIRDSVGIIFTVAETEDPKAWTWRTQYLSETYPMTKDYVLRLKDEEKQTYLTDEGDGIVLYDYLFGDKLYSVFETEGILLTSSYELVGEHLVFEVTSGKALSTEKGEVNNFSVDYVQRVVLSRKQ
ncbi:MAG: hypothetical protein AAF696_33375 [Bacteroidota bacterium]